MTDYQFAYLTSTNSPGFLSAPPLADRPDADTVVAGIAWDGATTNRPGSRFGPFAIRRASHMPCGRLTSRPDFAENKFKQPA
jgi:agmatinase